MQRPISTTTLLRFPLIFGAFIIAGGIAFAYRKEIIGDLDEERNAMFKSNAEDAKLLEDYKKKYKQLVANKHAT